MIINHTSLLSKQNHILHRKDKFQEDHLNLKKLTINNLKKNKFLMKFQVITKKSRTIPIQMLNIMKNLNFTLT